MIHNRRANENPVAHLSGLNPKLDRRHDRRNLDLEELRRLLASARSGQKHYGLTGEDRAMVSGLRAGELASLTPESFYLDATPPVVVVQPGYVKNRKEVEQPLPSEVAESLRGYLADKPAGCPFWPGYWSERAADMLKIDLEAAGIPYAVDGPSGPLFADFHSLRHSFVTLLERSGVSPKLAQELARHSDNRLTLQRYTHATLHDRGSAVESPLASS
jgi:integrase